MGTKRERKSRSGWFQRRNDRRALADQPAHEDVEAQLRALSRQWRRGIVSHVRGSDLTDLEEQMCTWIPDTGESPNALDALVYALARAHLGHRFRRRCPPRLRRASWLGQPRLVGHQVGC